MFVECKIDSLPQVPALGNPVCNAENLGNPMVPSDLTRKVNFETATKPAEQLGQLISAERTSIRIYPVLWGDLTEKHRQTSLQAQSSPCLYTPPGCSGAQLHDVWCLKFHDEINFKMCCFVGAASSSKEFEGTRTKIFYIVRSSEDPRISFSNALNWRLQNRQNRIVKIMKLQRGRQEFNGSTKKKKNQQAFLTFFSLASLSFFVRDLTNLMRLGKVEKRWKMHRTRHLFSAILPSIWKGFLLCDLYGCFRTGLPNERR